MHEEIKAAVDWWKKSLASYVLQDNGDVLQTALATWVRERQPKPTAEQVEEFGSALTALMTAVLPKYWDLERPDFGSACEGRCLSVDYGPDRMLSAAAQARRPPEWDCELSGKAR